MQTSCLVENVIALQQSSVNAWRQLRAREPADFAEVVARYSEPHRAYHTLEHILECQRWLAAARDLAERPCEVELALVYHDIVYDPRRSDNEKRSAELFRVHAEAVGLTVESTIRICTLIDETARHRSRHGDSALLNDIDLAVLGASPARYEIFEQQVRREYAHVDERLFCTGRQRVLRSFLETASIYATSFFETCSRAASALELVPVTRPSPGGRACAEDVVTASALSHFLPRRLIATAALGALVAALAGLLWYLPWQTLVELTLPLLPCSLAALALFPGLWLREGERPPDLRDDLERRRPVWSALSELYLDTELGAADRIRIASVLRASGYSAEQLEEILYLELHPVLQVNLWDIAGEWAGFDQWWLERQILERGRRRRGFAILPGKWMVRRGWEALRARL